MAYFRERNKLKTDFSGYEEVSEGLKNRLITVCRRYITNKIGLGNAGYFVSAVTLEHELGMNLDTIDIVRIIGDETYDCVFEAIEIFLAVAKSTAYHVFHKSILPDIQRVFELSGSVYEVTDKGEIYLKIDKGLAKSLEEAEEMLSVNKDSFEIFYETVGKFLSRKINPENAVKDIFIAFEGYVKEISGEKRFSNAIAKLGSMDILQVAQKAIVDKLHAYRSDAFKVAHSGNTDKPTELDVIWFLETVIAQVRLIDGKNKVTGSN